MAKLEVIQNFYYLGNNTGAQGGADASVIATIKSEWSKLTELLSLLFSKALSLLTKRRVYHCDMWK